jgi:hypothetical protein
MLRLSLAGGASRIVVVHDEIRRFVGMRGREVEPLTRDVSAAIPPLDLLARPEEGHVAIQGAAQGLIEADCHDDREVPALDQFGSKQEDAVEDQHSVLRGDH